jgi:GNAT superfamily N-acetyltransferase
MDHDRAARREVLAVRRVEHDAAARREHDAVEPRQRVDGLPFPAPEARLAFGVEDARDVDAGAAFDLGVGVVEVGAERAREFASDRRFPGPHRADKEDTALVGHAARPRPGRASRGDGPEPRGARVGGVLCVADDESTARLRLLLVDPTARGHGIGSRLVNACVEFARSAGYTDMVLWTNSVLAAARRIYEAAGFRLVEQTTHHSFGVDLVGETWRRQL